MTNIIQKGTVSTVRAAAYSLQYTGTFMEIPMLTVTIKAPAKIAFEIGDFIIWGYDGLTYTLKELPQVNKQATANTYGEAFVYENVKFVSALADVRYVEFLDVVPTSSGSHFSTLPTFSFYGNVFALIDRLNANLGRLYSNWIVQAADVESGDIFDALYTEREVKIDSPAKVWEALGLAYSMWGLGYIYYYDTLTSKHTIVIGATGGATGNFSYGQGNGLYMVGKAITKEDSIVTRLRAYGSTRNMPARYYNNKTILIDRLLIENPLLYLPNLMIPYDKWATIGDPDTAYINCNNTDVDPTDTAYAAYGIREQSVYFDGTNNNKEIYPTIEAITALEMRTAIAGYSGAQYGLYYSPDVTEYPDATRLDKIKIGDVLTDDGTIKTDTVYAVTANYAGDSGTEVMTTDVMTKRFDPIFSATLANEGEYSVTFGTQKLTVTGVDTDIEDGSLRVWIAKNGSRVLLGATIAGTLITGGIEFAMPELVISAQDGGDIYSIELDMDITIPHAAGDANISWVLDSGTATYTLTKVVPVTAFAISLKQIGFNIFKFLASAGQKPIISMTSGACTGRQFQITRADYIEASDSWYLTCNRQSDTSINQWFPNKNFKIAAEDSFVLLNINMPDILIDVAELRLYAEACKWLKKAKEQKYICEPKIDEVYMANNPQVIKEGMMMPLTDVDLSLSGSRLINSLTVTESEDSVRKFDAVLREDTDTDLLKYLNAQAKQQTASAVSTITNATTATSESAAPATSTTATAELGYTPENVANKTSVISVNSTTTQYPNAKALYDSLQLFGNTYIPKTQNVLLKEPTGFKEGAIVTYSSTNRTITLTGTVEAYFNGLLVPALVSGWVSPAHPTTLDHIYFLYYDGANFIWADNTFPGFYYLIIAIAYYRTANPFATRECHGFQQWQSHLADHYNIGTYRTGGGDITNLVLSSTTADNRRPIISECAIQDEDLLTNNPALTTKKYSQRFLSSANTINYALQANDIVPLSANNPYYNSFTSPNFGQTLMPDNSAMTVWLFEVPVTSDAASQEIRHAFVQGQSITLAANASPAALATAVSTEKLKSPLELNLGLSTVVASEYVCIHKFIITYSGGNWAITDSIKITGSRASQVGSPSGSYLTAVSTDATIEGNGTVGLPLSIATYAAKKAGDITLPFSASKLTSATLVVPPLAPTDLTAGQTAFYATESGFIGETPSGAGSVTSVGLSMPTGFSVANSPITESGTLAVTFASGYRMFTETEIGNKIETSLIGAANGITPLDSGGKVALQYLPNTLLKYIGVWNASTNTPTLTNPDTTKKGFVYNVSVVGTQFGISWGLGDWLIYNDSGVPEKSKNSDDVTSVAGKTGAVTLVKADITDATTWDAAYTHSQIAGGTGVHISDAERTNWGTAYTYSQVGHLPLGGGTLSGILVVSAVDRGLETNMSGGVSFCGNEINAGALGGTGVLYLGFRRTTQVYVRGENIVLGADNIGTYAVQNQIASAQTADYWISGKAKVGTLVLPTSATLASGEVGIYTTESGFVGEVPSGAGSVTAITLNTAGTSGIQVSLDNTAFGTSKQITGEGGTFYIKFDTNLQLMTATESSKLAGIAANANNYSLPTATLTDLGGVKIGSNVTITEGVISVHNAVTLGENQNGLSLSTQVLSLGLASTTTNGALSSTDWNTFNGKEPAIGTKGTAFNKDFGTTTGTVLEGRTFGTAAAAATTDFLAANGKAADSDLLDGHDTAYFQTALTNPVTGTGTGGYVPKFTGASTIGDSPISVSGTFIGLGKATPEAPLDIRNTAIDGNADGIRFGYSDAYYHSLSAYFTAAAASNNLGINVNTGNGTGRARVMTLRGNGNVDVGYGGTETEKFAVDGTTKFNGASTVVGNLTMLENINTNLRIPKVAPENATENQYYFYIVE